LGSIEENLKIWGREFDWQEGGESWSAVWGGSRSQWLATLWPRIGAHLPARTIVEIGCGFGRWSAYLRPYATERLVLVDLAERCVESVRRRFAGDPGVEVFRTDGSSLPELDPGSVDFVFSFDSLVHVELDALAGYVAALAGVLTPGGTAFLHHSNFKALLDARPGTYNHHWRAESVDADRFAELCRSAGLRCRTQEIVDWGTSEKRVVGCDCLSVVERAVQPPQATVRLDNPHFMAEAQSAAIRAGLYPVAPAGDRAPGPPVDDANET